MSHVVTITTQVRDPAALGLACGRLKLPPPAAGRHKLYASEEEGLAVRLAGWRWPVVCQPASGRLAFDHFGGRWGDPARLDELLQAYAIEKTKLEARRHGHTAVERPLADGSVRITLTTGVSA